jgi:molybdopterin molybdotransferase
MVQLTNDCFAFGGPLMSIDEAAALVRARLAPVAETETVPLDAAVGRVLAAALMAPGDLPRFANAAVDGYAVAFDDVAAGGALLPVVGRLPAGQAPAGPHRRGTALRIFTGAAMPAGADTVFMQEDVTLEGDTVVLPAGLKRFANMRPAGEDIAQGTQALPAGRVLTPPDIGLAAALGVASLTVRRRLRVAVFSTGDEVVDAGAPLPPAGIHDANRPVLIALLEALGCTVTDQGILKDRREAVAAALAEAAAGHDLILTSGGVSTGEEDHVKAAVEAAGALTFWRLAIKPGRPVAMGVVGGVPFIGLPGNPVAVYVTFAHVARAVVAALAGAEPPRVHALPVRAAFAYKKKEGRREYVRVSLVRAADGALEAVKHPREGAGILTSLTETDGLVELPEAVTRVDPGETVGFISYRALM